LSVTSPQALVEGKMVMEISLHAVDHLHHFQAFARLLSVKFPYTKIMCAVSIIN
jgi:hypothetical protein